MKDKKACIFYFLMTIILFDFGSQLRKISFMESIEKINNPIFSIFHIENTGSAFGLFEYKAKFLAILGIFAFLFLSYYVYKNICFKDKLPLLSITLFAAGILGNIVERLQFGVVVDYIKLNFINFAIFNAFDIMICLGLFLYFLSVLLEYVKLKKDSKE